MVYQQMPMIWLNSFYILPVIENNTTQTFHYCNDGICSRKEFVQEILNNLKPDLKINSIKNLTII